MSIEPTLKRELDKIRTSIKAPAQPRSAIPDPYEWIKYGCDLAIREAQNNVLEAVEEILDDDDVEMDDLLPHLKEMTNWSFGSTGYKDIDVYVDEKAVELILDIYGIIDELIQVNVQWAISQIRVLSEGDNDYSRETIEQYLVTLYGRSDKSLLNAVCTALIPEEV